MSVADADVQTCPVFRCANCGRDVIVLVGKTPAEPCCARCRMLPGWHRRPEVVALCEADELQFAAASSEPTEFTEVYP